MVEGNDNIIVKFENKKENIELKRSFEEFKYHCGEIFEIDENDLNNYIFYVIIDGLKIEIDNNTNYIDIILEDTTAQEIYIEKMNLNESNEDKILSLNEQLKNIQSLLLEKKKKLKLINEESNDYEETLNELNKEIEDCQKKFDSNVIRLKVKLYEIQKKKICKSNGMNSKKNNS